MIEGRGWRGDGGGVRRGVVIDGRGWQGDRGETDSRRRSLCLRSVKKKMSTRTRIIRRSRFDLFYGLFSGLLYGLFYGLFYA